MARRGRTLADGKLPSTTHVLYTVPDGMVTKIRWMSVFNGSGSNIQITVFVRRFGEFRNFSRMTLDAFGGHGRVVDTDEDLTLAEGDAIEANAATGDTIQYVIGGVEEPVGEED